MRTLYQLKHASRNAVSRRQCRAAFTLLELMIVVSVIAVIAGLSWPRLTRFLKQQVVESNAEQVRQMLDRARVESVDQGIILQVRFEPEGQKYVMLPYDPVDESQQTRPQGVVSTSFTDPSGSRVAGAEQKEIYQVLEMSEDCRFFIERGDVGTTPTYSRLGDQWLAHLENGYSDRDTIWMEPILYYPDGSATDAIVIVMDEDKRYIQLHVRGLTGAVRATPLERISEVPGATTDLQ